MQKICKSVCILLILLLLAATVTPVVLAADSFPDNALIIVGGRTVTNSMKIADVKRLFGEPKLATVSPFGGGAYTFYGTDYSDYLYLETNSEGYVAAYGSISPNYRTASYSYGTQDDNYVSSGERLTLSYQDNTVIGMVGHNRQATGIDAGEYNALLADQMCVYGKALARHTVEMYNAVSYLYGDNYPVVYDDDIYDSLIQLFENGNNPEDYAVGNHLEAYSQLYCEGSSYFTNWRYYNPLSFAVYAKNYNARSGCTVGAFLIYRSDDGIAEYNGVINPKLFHSQVQTIPLNDEEQRRLEVMRRYSDECIAHNQAVEKYYDEEPDVSSLPLKPGVINTEALDSSVAFLNMIRAGAGIDPVERNDQLCAGAQAKAAYSVYLSENNISNSSPHDPPKIAGISDEFYSLCQSGGAENLFWGNTTSSIYRALDDGYGDPVYCGHRYNLLNPYVDQIGLGSVSDQGVHKFSASSSHSYDDFICWPSKGVTPLQAFYRNGYFRWSVEANNGRSFTDRTQVEVKLLNTGDVWHFDNDSEMFTCTSWLLSFCDTAISVSDGQVYEVTLKNVKNGDGSVSDYTYRSAIVSLIEEGTGTAEVSLDRSSASLTTGDELKLNGCLSVKGRSPFTVTWESSHSSVATVSACGLVTALGAGTAIITARCGDSVAQCRVTVSDAGIAPYALYGDVDGNGRIEATDATMIQRCLAEIPVAMTAEGRRAGDVDLDSSLTILDASFIQRWLAEIDTPTSVGKKR